MTEQNTANVSFIWPTAFAGLIGAALLSGAVLVGPVDAGPLHDTARTTVALR